MSVKRLFIAFLLVMCAFPSEASCSDKNASVQQRQSPQAFVRDFVSKSPFGSESTTRFSMAQVPGTDLTVVYLSGQIWCGSGGCTLLILKPGDGGFGVIGKVTLANLPIRLLNSTHHGLPDIGLVVKGGGINSAHEVALQFDGSHYPSNPTTSKKRTTAKNVGEVLIDSNSSAVVL